MALGSPCRIDAVIAGFLPIGGWERAAVIATGRLGIVSARITGRSIVVLLAGFALLAFDLGRVARAQQAVPLPWQTDGDTRRRIEPLPADRPGAAAPPGQAGSPQPATKAPAEAGKARVSLSAFLTQDAEAIDQGLVWRLYSEPAPNDPSLPKLLGTWREAAPTIQVAPGKYIVNVAYGRAHLSRQIAVTAPRDMDERFVLQAGGLRLTAYLGSTEKAPDVAVSYDIFQGDADQLGGRAKVAGGLRPGVIVRLNAGLYHIVSTMGDANATLSADVTVEAGKLTDAVASHHAARVSLKLVTRAGGDAQADTQWTIHTMQGDLVRETQGALPTHILAAGQYMAAARHGGRLYQRQFTVAAGEATQVEIVMQ